MFRLFYVNQCIETPFHFLFKWYFVIRFFFRYSGEKKIGYEISFESLVFNLNYLPILKKK